MRDLIAKLEKLERMISVAAADPKASDRAARVEYQRFVDRVNRTTDKEIGEALLRAKEAQDG